MLLLPAKHNKRRKIKPLQRYLMSPFAYEGSQLFSRSEIDIFPFTNMNDVGALQKILKLTK